MTAFVIGNGTSRKDIDLYQLQKHGMTYGCNALYRDFTPDVLVTKDSLITREIEKDGYALNNRFYTRLPSPNATILDKNYRGYCSGTNALHISTTENHKKIYLLGFDFGSTTDTLNNYYADTECYRESTAKVYKGEMKGTLTQVILVINEHPSIDFIRVVNDKSEKFQELHNISHLSEIDVTDFIQRFNM
jgi:hypothetical protein